MAAVEIGGGGSAIMVPLRAQYNQRKQQNNKNKITLWKPKEHCVQFAVVMYEKKKKKKKRGERAKGSGRHRRGGAKLVLLPPIFELKIILEEP